MMKSHLEIVFAETMASLRLCEGARLLVAFSGGSDSTALLHLLSRMGKHPLLALHVHHGIRGAEADADAAFCADFCASRGIPFRLARVDVPAYAKRNRLGIEESARILRYAALRRCLTEEGFDYIATAHNASDQVETVLMHLTRGSGLNGLCGMQARRDDLIRPLLAVGKAEIEAYCADQGLSYVVDSSNLDMAMTRNAIRARVMPPLKEINPRLEAAVATLTASLCADAAYLEEESASHRLGEGRRALAALADPILHRVLRRCFGEAFPNAPMLTALQTRQMAQMLRASRANGTVTVPGGGVFCVDRETVRFESVSKEAENEGFAPFILCEGWQSFARGEGMILCRRGILTEDDKEKCADFQNIYNLLSTMLLNSATMTDTVYVRPRRAGDAYFDGLHTRDVRKLLGGGKVPLAARRCYPLLVRGDAVLRVPGFAHHGDEEATPEEGVTLVIFYPRKQK